MAGLAVKSGVCRWFWGALKTARALLKVNQPDGFDCPGCAWPEPLVRAEGGVGHSAFEFCENGVKAVSHETTGRRVTAQFFESHPVSELRSRSDHWLEDQGRLTEPLRYDKATDRYQPVTWDEAFWKSVPISPKVRRMRWRSIPLDVRATKRRFCTSCTGGSLARTIFLIVQICVTNPVVPR